MIRFIAWFHVALAFLLASSAFAQEEPPPVEEPVNWLAYAAVAVNAVLVPLAVQVLKPLWAKAPAFVKTVVPLVAGSLLTMAGLYLSEVLGAPVDLSPLVELFLGATVGLGATMTFKMGAASK